MAALKGRQLGLRVDAQTAKRLEVFESGTGIETVTLARNAIIAALDFFEANGSISFPLIVSEPPKNPIKGKK